MVPVQRLPSGTRLTTSTGDDQCLDPLLLTLGARELRYTRLVEPRHQPAPSSSLQPARNLRDTGLSAHRMAADTDNDVPHAPFR